MSYIFFYAQKIDNTLNLILFLKSLLFQIDTVENGSNWTWLWDSERLRWIIKTELQHYSTRFPEMGKTRKKLSKPDTIFFEKWIAMVSKNGKMKMFHSCPKE